MASGGLSVSAADADGATASDSADEDNGKGVDRFG